VLEAIAHIQAALRTTGHLHKYKIMSVVFANLLEVC
jgi:hypothetical protein